MFINPAFNSTSALLKGGLRFYRLTRIPLTLVDIKTRNNVINENGVSAVIRSSEMPNELVESILIDRKYADIVSYIFKNIDTFLIKEEYSKVEYKIF